MQNEEANKASKMFHAFTTRVSGDWDSAAPIDGGVPKLTSYMVNYKMQNEEANKASKMFHAFTTRVSGDWDSAAPIDGGVPKLTSYMVNYIECLFNKNYKPIMAQVLQQQQKSRAMEEGGGLHLKMATQQLMQILENALEQRASASEEVRQVLVQLFLITKHWYVYIRAKNNELATLLESTSAT